VPTPTARFPRRCASTSVTLGPGVEPPKLFRRGVGVLLVDVAAVARLVRPHAFESDSRVFASEGHAFEERLRQQSLSGGAPLARLRKMVAFDRFLARVAQKQPGPWIVKGGFALQLRLCERARTTKDIDVSALNPWTSDQTIVHLRAAVSLELGDWFEFEVGEPAEAATGAPGRGFRFPIRCLLDGRRFETFHLDVGYGDPILEAPVELVAPISWRLPKLLRRECAVTR
jgi:hypothetical protein